MDKSRLKKLIKQAFESEISSQLSEYDRISHEFGASGGICVAATLIGKRALTERRVKCKAVGGRAMFSVNTSNFGLIDYGYSGQIANVEAGQQLHYWLQTEIGIVDFALPLMRLTHERDNKLRGITDNTFLLPKDYIIKTKQLSTYDELYRGKIGWHYEAIEGAEANLATLKSMSQPLFDAMRIDI